MSATLEPSNQRRLSVSGSNRVLRAKLTEEKTAHDTEQLPEAQDDADDDKEGV
jgi:hypothetical protein